MDGSIAQYIALTCHGNAFLNGHKFESLLETNSTCQFCEKVNFKKAKKPFFGLKKEVEIAKTPDEWFYYLKSLGAYGIRLSNSPQDDPGISDRMSVGFVGGGRIWLMEVILPKNQSEYWLSKWKAGNRNSPKSRIWKVTYVQVGQGTTPSIKATDLTSVIDEMVSSLREIHKFAERHGIKFFTQCFEEALDTIDSRGKNFYGYHKDLAPKEILSEQAITILNACQRAWVFGGMGSWNDMMFEGEIKKEYDRISEQLYKSLNEAFAAGANASFYR